MLEDLKMMVGNSETIMYEGKPDKKCFIFESIFNPMLPIAILWAIFDSFFFMNAFGDMKMILIPFMIFHMMPVWIYLSGLIFMIIRYRNINYVITDHAVYVTSGIFTMNLKMKTFQELSRVNLHRGIFDQIFKVGDINITTNEFDRKGRPDTLNIDSINDYANVYQLVKKLQKDIYADTMFPNDYRPEENHGYKTKYKG